MTFSLLGRCLTTRQLGVVATTSDLAIGARVPCALAGVGVAVTQARTDPRLGQALIAALRAGLSPSQALAQTVAGHANHNWRQLGLLGVSGRPAAYTGDRAWPFAGAIEGADCLAIGNMLAGEQVLAAMVRAFAGTEGELAPRLLAGLEAGQRAGGETAGDGGSSPLCSAVLVVVERESFPLVDLRIDHAADPIAELVSLWRAYEPWGRHFVVRALDPDHAHGPSSITT